MPLDNTVQVNKGYVEKPKRVSEISNEENSGEAPTYL
jgi:hypothetical protein